MFCCMLRGLMSPLRFFGSFMPFIAAAGSKQQERVCGRRG
jgi:hypothetical protein